MKKFNRSFDKDYKFDNGAEIYQTDEDVIAKIDRAQYEFAMEQKAKYLEAKHKRKFQKH